MRLLAAGRGKYAAAPFLLLICLLLGAAQQHVVDLEARIAAGHGRVIDQFVALRI
jgi:hypothetical protein